MGAMRFVEKHCNEAVHLRRQSDQMLPIYRKRLILLRSPLVIKFWFMVLAKRCVKFLKLFLKWAEGLERLDLDLCLPICPFSDGVCDFGIPRHNDFHRKERAPKKTTVAIQNVAGLATVHNLKVHEFEIRANLIHGLGDNSDAIVE